MSGMARKSRGVALITALLVTAIATVVAVGMAARQQLDIRRAGNLFEGDQAYLYALGIENWAQGVLATDARRPGAPNDHLKELWASALPPIDVEGGQVIGKLEDLQGRFNINNLINGNDEPSAPDVLIFQRLLSSLDIDIDLVYPLIDWIDANPQLTLPNGAEDVEYLGRDPSYRAANRALTSTSELLLVKDFTAEIFAALAPYISALPEQTPINVNTAPAAVLAALANDVSPIQAEGWVQARDFEPYTDAQNFLVRTNLLGPPPQLASDKISVSSKYFLLSSVAKTGRSQVSLYSLLQRTTQPALKVSVLMRGQGAF